MPRTDREAFEFYMRSTNPDTPLERNGEGYAHLFADETWEGFKAGVRAGRKGVADSAQPSPGGQGDALVTDEMVQAACKVWAETPGQREDWMRSALEAALTARQPVYEGHTWVSDYVLAGLRERAALPLQLRNGEVWHWQGDGHDFPDSLACPVIMSADTLRALLAARQPVELIAQKVGDCRVTVAEDSITVSRRRDIVFAYSAGDPEPINARQLVPYVLGNQYLDRKSVV